LPSTELKQIQEGTWISSSSSSSTRTCTREGCHFRNQHVHEDLPALC
jgi:hypothetical protein